MGGESETVERFESRSSAISAMEEDETYLKTFQEEMNEIMEAFYAIVSEEDIREYQRFVESISQRKIAEGALQPGSKAPDFEMEDQDGEMVILRELLKKGPVVLVFYRGKWCPHCNRHIMAMQEYLSKFEAKGASMVCVSPMLPDGTHYLATKRSLNFPICSDVGNVLARKYNITFEIQPFFRDSMVRWGEDIPLHNGDDTWEVPLPATYVIDTDGRLLWSFIDNDPAIRADPEEILHAISTTSARETFSSEMKLSFDASVENSPHPEIEQIPRRKDMFNRRHLSSTFKTNFKKLFGKKRDPPSEFLSRYLLP
ncbi:alkyl hydroperoxide reductase [Nitzschia inconspicua]|uniref:thioredoxin-dependent peroxiredoxin n=1 Tax=Nitzschia inconspicua TaxID=303405 RepID=A0A9K3K8E3_9STRA|nr:alkyl hydroperoxide reductase [Nitzschia inconspicua]KAG7353068.1 alkyl hydroperoxide reductase [Nitzschia inconspicua]